MNNEEGLIEIQPFIAEQFAFAETRIYPTQINSSSYDGFGLTEDLSHPEWPCRTKPHRMRCIGLP